MAATRQLMPNRNECEHKGTGRTEQAYVFGLPLIPQLIEYILHNLHRNSGPGT